NMFALLFFFQAEDGIRDATVTGVQTCALPICVAELAVAVIAPAVGHLPCGEGARMVAAGTDGREAERPEERDGPVAAGNGGGASPGLAGLGRVATQLTAVVGPPAIDRVPGGDPARVQRSGRQREEDVSPHDENGNG